MFLNLLSITGLIANNPTLERSGCGNTDQVHQSPIRPTQALAGSGTFAPRVKGHPY